MKILLIIIKILAIIFLIGFLSYEFYKILYPVEKKTIEIKLTKQEYFTKQINNNLISENIFLCSDLFNLEPELLLSIIYIESSYNANARNYNDNGTVDIGLMQLNNDTFKNISIKDLYNIETNILIGSKHLKELFDKYDNNEIKVLFAYNCGRVKKVPVQTIDYAYKVIQYKIELKEKYNKYLSE